MFRKCLMPLLLICTLLIAACGGESGTTKAKNLILYSHLDKKFTDALVQMYNAEHDKISITAIYELKQDTPKPDLYLADGTALEAYANDNKLKSVLFSAGDSIPVNFKHADSLWYGAFYDPAVLLVNQQYARKIGQKRIRSWSDLENYRDVRITMENLTNDNNTIAFLGALASKMGENVAMNYLWNINHFITQYSKFSFTPVRMVAVGDADIAITRQSYVSQYLENHFPAYIVYPSEGTPITLYGAGVAVETTETAAATAFIEWLIADDDAKRVAHTTGYMFLLPQGIKKHAVNPKHLWLNTRYLRPEQQEYLTSRWLDTVRFSENK